MGHGLPQCDDGLRSLTLPIAPQFQNESDARRWVEAFRLEHGRAPRILHIGNIANNAFRNAAIQRRHGIAADIVCYDYNHVMGCPEWEWNTIAGDYDAFVPDWWKLTISGPARPEWYIQGSQAKCRALLRARISGSRLRRLRARLNLLDEMLSLLRHGVADDLLSPQNFPATRRLAPEIGMIPRVFLRLLRKTEKTQGAAWWQEIAAMGWAGLRGKTAPDETREWVIEAANTGRMRMLVRLATAVPAAGLLALCRKLLPDAFRDDTDPSDAGLDPALMTELADAHRRIFPETPEAARQGDLALAQDMARNWADILPHYDIVQGYSLDGLIPLFCGHRRFLAYEHGTIREIPFEDTPRGRLCWLTYRLAPFALITNSDVLPATQRMGLDPARLVLIPHAFDDSALLTFRQAHGKSARPVGPPVFFAPARHHWTSGGGSWEKGNDVYLRAAGQLAAEGHDFRLVLVEWGEDVGASRELIRDLGIENRTEWLPLLDKDALYGHFLADACIIDQFRLPALGGVSYEALTLGARVITHIDRPVLKQFFGEAPPLLDAADVAGVAARMLEVIRDPADEAGVGAASSDWAARFHSTERLMALQANAYAALLQQP